MGKMFKLSTNSQDENMVTRLETLEAPDKKFLQANATDFLSSKKREFMLEAQKYDNAENTEILEREKWYLDADGHRVIDNNITNHKLVHTKFINLVDQKISYLLGNTFSIQADEETFLAEVSESERDELVSYLEKRLGAQFLRKLRRAARMATVTGISWLQAYYNERGELKFKRIPSEQIAPFWVDADHTELEAVLRVYDEEILKADGTRVIVRKYEYHTAKGAWYYLENENGELEDDDSISGGIDGHHGHFKLIDNETEEVKEAIWGKVPFIPVKFNGNELPLLKKVKSLVDEYDFRTSDTANILEDTPNSVKVVRGYDGTDAVEFTKNLNTFRVVFVDQDGGMDTENAELNTKANEDHLTRLHKDIYESGSGVDLQNTDLGNASGVALKFRYLGLDIEANEFAQELNASLQQLSWFIKMDLISKGEMSENILNISEEYIFNKNSLINESEVIENVKNSAGIISEETRRANHPWVTRLNEENERLEREREEMIQLMIKQQGEMYSFAPDEAPKQEPINNEDE